MRLSTNKARPGATACLLSQVGRACVIVGALAGTTGLRAAPVDRDEAREAIAAYRAGKLDAGDTLAARSTDALARTALEWVALRTDAPRIDFERVSVFAKAHPDWPASALLRHKMEARLHNLSDPLAVQTFFAFQPPETPWGKLALAWSLKATGRVADASKLARAVFRESDFNGYTENVLKAEFGDDLTKADYKYRADRLLYKERVGTAIHYAAQAGSDVLALAKARAAVIAERPSDQAIAAVPDALRKDPGLILAEVQKLRRADRPLEAAWLMESAPHEAARLIDGDEWWDERRLLARKLLDAGKIKAAYVMCAMSTAISPEAKVEANFHAGWIALRFLHESSRAAYHFAAAEALAKTPTSIARVAYWQGRTEEETEGHLAQAKAAYKRASIHGSTFYGQLARQVLGVETSLIQVPPRPTTGDARAEAIRVIELLYDLGDSDDAFGLAVEAATNLTEPAQVSALAVVIAERQDAHSSLVIGKIISGRGMPADLLAFPTFGIPAYTASASSASQAIVYSVARQESAFTTAAVSKAGAKGLMQMIESTARHTAARERLPFDRNRLLRDASFNVRLGAAHLGELISEQKGSLILTFAAYNAGGGRVKQWIDAYGDPRKPGVDPVDWVERIPFGETRNYVQRVMANVTMYEAIFADKAKNVVAKSAREARL